MAKKRSRNSKNDLQMKGKIIIRVFSAFAGFDTQFIALLAYARWYNQNTNGPLIEFVLVGWCEIDKDAITCHNALFPEVKSCHYPDITKVDWERVPDFDVLIYSSCCQSLTIAGSQKGMTEGSGTPSSLIWYIRDAIRVKRPKFCILENVPDLLASKFEGQFEKWTNTVAKFGYRNTWSKLCAADFGVPQNRNRVFLVSVRNDIKKNIYFPKPVGCKKHAESLLEKSVDEKYYYSEEDAVAFVFNLMDKTAVDFDMPHIHHKGRCDKQIITPSLQGYNNHVCPTLVADKNYGKTNYKKFLSSTYYPRPGVLEVWHTTEQVMIPYMEEIDKAVADTDRKFEIINRSKDDILAQIKNMGVGDYFRLRRLTPSECFRLMGIDKKNIGKLTSSGVPEGQLYKMAGNAIVVKVMCHLYASIFNDVSVWL